MTEPLVIAAVALVFIFLTVIMIPSEFATMARTLNEYLHEKDAK